MEAGPAKPREPETTPRGPSEDIGPALHLAGVLTLVGWVFGGMGAYAAASGTWDAAVVAFIMAALAWIFALKSFTFYVRFPGLRSRGPSHRLHTLLEQRMRALRRAEDLKRYANFCELESRSWPEDSIDRAELLAYASVARRLAGESLREWRELERKARAERFERITSKRQLR
jgi:hypothetical protein